MTERLYIGPEEILSLFPARPSDCHKGDFGYVALIGGSIEYSGAIRLAAMANASVRSGAGVTSVAAPRSICPVIAGQILEATLIPLSDEDGRLVFSESEFEAICRRYDCITFGMGIGLTDETVRAVEYLLTRYDKTLIIDADGLNAMAQLGRSVVRDSRAELILTPHLGEYARLSGRKVAEAKSDPVLAASELADELGATVLLKGPLTVVAGPAAAASPDRRVWLTDRGCPGMASGGSGDVLSGIMSAVCANAEDKVLAAAACAYINGAAGELAQERHSDVTMTAADTAGCVAEVIENVLHSR